MTAAGVRALQNMQLSDGGWGWFSGYGEHSCAAHHRHRRPRPADRQAERRRVCRNGMLERGIDWLKNYQAEQIVRAQQRCRPRRLRGRNMPTTWTPSSTWSWSTAAANNAEMREFLYPRPHARRRSTPRRCSAWLCTSRSRSREAGHDPQEHRAVRRPGRGEPDRLPAAARQTTTGGTGTAARSRPTPTTSSCCP